MSIGNIFIVVMCIVLLVKRKDYYLRKNKKGKYSLAIPKNERTVENVIKNEREMSIINHSKMKKWNNRKLVEVSNSPFAAEYDVVNKKEPVLQYKSLNEKQLNKLEELRRIIDKA